MGIIDKLKDILFDEETVEIPIISDEEYESLKPKKSKKTPKIEKLETEEDDIKITKLESLKKRSKKEEEKIVEPTIEDTLFDMPKLKEEAEEEVRTSSFTFPVFDDDDLMEDEPKRVKTPEVSLSKRTSRLDDDFETYKTSKKAEDKSNFGYQRRESERERIYSHSDGIEEKKPFTLSPIISPVYGILNENYTKEDIVSKQERAFTRSSFDKPNLDDVRKKAYGTLEDDIESSLTENFDKDLLSEDASEKNKDKSLDEGISIDDLLANDEEEKIVIEKEPKEKKEEKKEQSEDLFDLIDSLYEGGAEK